MRETIIKSCQKILEFSFYLLFSLVPLILTPYNYELFEFNKMLVVYGIAAVIACAWVLKAIAGRKTTFQRTPLDIVLLLFLLSQIISTIFSIDRHSSIYGYYSRFHGGLLSTLSYIFLYYALVSNLNKKKVLNILYVSLATGLLVSIYGILEHFGIDAKYWVQDVQNRVFSSLGQPNWLSAYLDILLLLTAGFIFSSKSKIKIGVYGVLFAVYYLTLLYTKSRSGFSAFIFCLFLFSLFILLKAHLKKTFKPVFISLTAYCLLLATITFFVQPPFFHLDKIGYSAVGQFISKTFSGSKTAPVINKSAPNIPQPAGPALEVGGSESGEIRKIVWRGAWDIFTHYPLFGSGVETFAFSYYLYRPASHNLVSEWDFLYNKAHNEFLNYASTTGIFGLGTYLAVIAGFLFLFVRFSWKNFKKTQKSAGGLNEQEEEFNFLLPAFIAVYFSILITNFFGFSVVIIGLYFWLIPAFYFFISGVLPNNKILTLNFSKNYQVISPKGNKKVKYEIIPPISNWEYFFMVLTLLILISNLISLYQYWLADTKYALANNYNKSGAFTTSYPLIKEAISFKKEPIYYDELSFAAANLAVMAFTQKQNELATNLINESLNASSQAIKKSPNNVNFFKTRTKVYYLLSNINEKYNYEALNALSKAAELAPTDAKIYYNLAILYGRVNQYDKAIETLRKTIKLKNNYSDAYYALGVFLADTGNRSEAIKVFEDYLSKSATEDPKFSEKLTEWGR